MRKAEGKYRRMQMELPFQDTQSHLGLMTPNRTAAEQKVLHLQWQELTERTSYKKM